MKLVCRRFAFPFLPGGQPVTCGARGLDKIAVKFSVGRLGPRKDVWEEKTSRVVAARKVTRSRTSLGIRGFQALLTEVDAGQSSLRIEMTPAYVAGFASNVDVPADRWLVPLVSAAIEVSEGVLDVVMMGSLASVRITRLDLVRNLQMEFPGDVDTFFAGLALHVPPYARFSRSFAGSDGRLTGVKFGNNARSVSVYDKHRESKGQCPAGTIRWESTLRHGALKRNGLDRLGGVTPAKVEAARRCMWEWSGMMSAVASPATFLETIREHVLGGSITRRQAVSLIGSTLLGSALIPLRTRQNHRTLIRDVVGVTVDLSDVGGLLGQASSWVLEADYNSGKVIRRPV
jgi:hypothetical protein